MPIVREKSSTLGQQDQRKGGERARKFRAREDDEGNYLRVGKTNTKKYGT